MIDNFTYLKSFKSFIVAFSNDLGEMVLIESSYINLDALT